MGFLDRVFNRNKKIGYSFDLEFMDLFAEKSKRIHMKQLAIETCISFLARTVSQTEFRVKNKDEYIKNEIYYRLNTRPNKNMTASTFWQKFISKLIYDNEVLVIQADDGDLLIADDFQHKKYAVYEDIFTNVVIRDYEFKDTFKQSDVLHLKYGNEKLSTLLDSLFYDYGDLFGYIIRGQKRKNQLRATVDMDMLGAKSAEHQAKLQEFIDNMYKAVEEKDVAIIPQQPGFEYKEQSGNGIAGQSVDEINKVTGGYFDQVAIAIGIPPSLIRGDMADVEKQTKNYMFFTVSPLLKKIKEESDVKFFTKKEQLDGKSIEIRKPSYRDIFDLATAVDKLVSSGVFNGNEVRSELGKETTDEQIHKEYFITKNYQSGKEAIEGGDNE
ncbi:phage portal protein [Oceanobacillus sp. FSL H7-0719]|uniref:phage portal protein n=1 Tax=Oceanobacillus sp. FSL H7-0719 TaxID=2954507 RepID=UPI00324FB84C